MDVREAALADGLDEVEVLEAVLEARLERALQLLLPLQQLAPPLELPIDRTSMVWHPCASDDPGHVWFRAQLDTILAELRRPS